MRLLESECKSCCVSSMDPSLCSCVLARRTSAVPSKLSSSRHPGSPAHTIRYLTMCTLAVMTVACLGLAQALPNSHPPRLVRLEGIVSNIQTSLGEVQSAQGAVRKLHRDRRSSSDSVPGSGACAWQNDFCMPDGKYFMKLGALGDSDHYVSELQSCYQDTRYNGTCDQGIDCKDVHLSTGSVCLPSGSIVTEESLQLIYSIEKHFGSDDFVHACDPDTVISDTSTKLCSDTWMAYFGLIGCTSCMSELATVRGPVNDICKTAGSLVECTSDERTNEARTEICGGDPSCENLSPESDYDYGYAYGPMSYNAEDYHHQENPHHHHSPEIAVYHSHPLGPAPADAPHQPDVGHYYFTRDYTIDYGAPAPGLPFTLDYNSYGWDYGRDYGYSESDYELPVVTLDTEVLYFDTPFKLPSNHPYVKAGAKNSAEAPAQVPLIRFK